MNNDKQNDSNRLMWSEFQGLKNNDDVLHKKAQSLAYVIYDLATDIIEMLISKENDPAYISEEKMNSNFERFFDSLLYFYMNISDRTSFAILGAEKRSFFVDALFLELREKLSKQVEGGVNSEIFRNKFGQEWNTFQDLFGRYKLVIADSKNLKDSVLWNYCKIIVDTLFPDNIASIITVFYGLLADGIIWLNISQLLKED